MFTRIYTRATKIKRTLVRAGKKNVEIRFLKRTNGRRDVSVTARS